MLLDPAGMAPRDVYALMIDLIVPRPIALVSSMAGDGSRNLAPFSYFVGLCSRPPLVGIGVGHRKDRREGLKDTARNIRDTSEFVICVTTDDIVQRVVQTSGEYPPEVDEYELAGLTATACDVVTPPRVAESPVAMECRLDRMIDLHGNADFIIGEVVCFHVRDDLVGENGRVDPARLRPVGRLGSNLYTRLGEILSIDRPT